MQEHRIETVGPLHRADGSLAEPGYATSLLLNYNRFKVRAPKHRIKEWDYYLVNDDEYAVALTVGDLGYMGLISASVVDLVECWYKTSSVITPLPMGRFSLPERSTEGVTEFKNNRVHLRFEVKEGTRTLRARFDRFDGDEPLHIDAVLDEEPRDSMVIATPWAEDPKAFYYNQKIVGMRAQGSFRKGLTVHGFRPDDSFGLLDWGRGVWTRDNTWFWAVAQGWQDGRGNRTVGSHRFGLNFGYGFGDTSAASENMAFVDGVAHKLGRVDFGIIDRAGAAEKNVERRFDLMAPWHMTDDEGRLDLVFTPSVDRKDYINLALVITDQHQVFGTLSGKVVLDDGSEFIVEGLHGSAEVVRNKY